MVQMSRYKLELQQLYQEHYSPDMLEPGYIDSELDYQDVVLWIDPIDARKTWTTAPHDITTIVGISVNGWPKAGILHKPCFDENISRTYIGTIESGCFMYDTSH